MGGYTEQISRAALAHMVGRRFARVEVDRKNAPGVESWNVASGDEIRFIDTAGNVWTMNHNQDGCEAVWIEDICGDVADFVDAEVVSASVATSNNPNASDSGTWTFYQFRTTKGDVTIRWNGESNGYYSEEAEVNVDIPLKEAP